MISGFFGGWPDYIIMRIVDALYSLPSLLVAVVIMSFLRGVLTTSDQSAVAGLATVNAAITFGIPRSITLDASLSFLGIGVTPPMPSWGTMISESLAGDALRDALDPLMKR